MLPLDYRKLYIVFIRKGERMRGLTNKQDAVRRVLAREFITMIFRGENNKQIGRASCRERVLSVV